jgi:hypothetical protein
MDPIMHSCVDFQPNRFFSNPEPRLTSCQSGIARLFSDMARITTAFLAQIDPRQAAVSDLLS